jgi:hypothetical protein
VLKIVEHAVFEGGREIWQIETGGFGISERFKALENDVGSAFWNALCAFQPIVITDSRPS